MQEVILTNESKTNVLHQYLSQTYTPALVQHSLQTENYLQQELSDFQKILDESDNLEEALLQKKTVVSKTVKQLNDKIQSEQDKMKKAEVYKKGKKDELTAIQKAIDSISTAMKETCSKIDSKELSNIGQLPQGMEQFMAQLFSVIYNENQNKFNWPEFKAKVFNQDKGADFQSRLANFQFKGVNPEKEGLLLQMKQDPQFQRVYQDPKYTKAFLDIADWIQFVVTGIENQRKRDTAHQEFERIDKEFAARKVELDSYLKTYEFWNSQLDYVEKQLIFLNQFKPNIKSVESEITQSKNTLNIHIDNFVGEINKVNNLLQQTI